MIEPHANSVISHLRQTFPDLLGDIRHEVNSHLPPPAAQGIREKIVQRSNSIHHQVLATVEEANAEIGAVIDAFLRWMLQRTNVRVLGAGRARLAVSIPAQRLAHGGAHVYIQDDFVPMAHTIKGGAILAASASGETESVLSIMRLARKENRDVEIIGIAARDAHAFEECCDIFIPISPELPDHSNPLRALADNEELVIALVLDALVAAAGRKGGFIEALWRVGHENLGPTGPYDQKKYRPALAAQTLDFTSGHELRGRSEIVNQLREQLLHKNTRAVLISGPSGVGKTALSNRLLEIVQTGVLADRFETHHWTSAYRESWEGLITQIGQAVLGKDQVIKARVTEIEERLLAESKRRSILIIVDNLEPRQLTRQADFLRRWCAVAHSSVFLATSIDPIPLSIDTALHLPLKGVPREAQFQLLGQGLRNRLGDNDLLPELDRLEGIPINLLYLRWLDPPDIKRFRGHVERLLAGSLDKGTALEDTILGLTRSPTPFMALGIIRSLEFPESLLTYFWDCLGGGSTESYTDMRDRFIAHGLLIPSARSASGSFYRIAEDIHKYLYRILCSRIGEERVSTVQLFAAEYYRRQLEAQGGVTLDAVTSFVYHCFECGEFQWAYSQLFDASVLAQLQRSGMALQVRSVLQQLREHEIKLTPEQRCRVLIAEASAANDLSEFEACLALMQQAQKLLGTAAPNPLIPRDSYSVLRREIEYFSAVAFSNVGRSRDCVRSYCAAIASSADLKEYRSCLSLTYLAHELKYHDLKSSIAVGALALQLASSSPADGLLSRVSCSLAESKIFSGDIDDADALFERGEKLCRSGNQIVDARELGRIMKNWSLVSLIRGDRNLTDQRLSEARELSSSVGDRRRVASGDLYRSILTHKWRGEAKGIILLEDCIAQLVSLGDGRYLVPAILTRAYWANANLRTSTEDLFDAVELSSATSLPAHLRDKRYVLPYVEFWRNYFRPTLLDVG